MEYISAFIVGGVICLIGELLLDLTKLTPARVMVLFVVAGVVLGALGVYGPLVEFAGCGATVPLTGFGWALSEGVKEAVKNDSLFGILSGGLASSAVGITWAMILGVLGAVFARSGDRK